MIFKINDLQHNSPFNRAVFIFFLIIRNGGASAGGANVVYKGDNVGMPTTFFQNLHLSLEGLYGTAVGGRDFEGEAGVVTVVTFVDCGPAPATLN